MISKKFIIHITGPSCVGKSTIFEALSEKLSPGSYLLSYDKIKWQFGGYDRCLHRKYVRKLIFEFYGIICQSQIPILLDCYLRDANDYVIYKDIAAKNGYKFISIELSAPQDVLLKRFNQRVKNAKLVGKKISVTEESVFLTETSRRPYVPENTPIFDTARSNKDEIVEKIIKLLAQEIEKTEK